MSLAKKCDICGKLYEQYNTRKDKDNINGLLFLNIDMQQHYYSHGVTDCCPECMEAIKDFIVELGKKGSSNT